MAVIDPAFPVLLLFGSLCVIVLALTFTFQPSFPFLSFPFLSYHQPSLYLQLAHTLPHRLLRHHTLRDKDIDQPLQRLHVLLWQHIVVHSHRDEMHKA